MSEDAPNKVDLKGENVQWDFRENMSYGDYLSLDIPRARIALWAS